MENVCLLRDSQAVPKVAQVLTWTLYQSWPSDIISGLISTGALGGGHSQNGPAEVSGALGCRQAADSEPRAVLDLTVALRSVCMLKRIVY